MRIRWTAPAADDLESIYNYLTRHKPHLAHSTIMEIHQAILSLKKFPDRGRKGNEEGVRELLHERLPYIVAYCVKPDAVEVLHIWHPSRNRE